MLMYFYFSCMFKSVQTHIDQHLNSLNLKLLSVTMSSDPFQSGMQIPLTPLLSMFDRGLKAEEVKPDQTSVDGGLSGRQTAGCCWSLPGVSQSPRARPTMWSNAGTRASVLSVSHTITSVLFKLAPF